MLPSGRVEWLDALVMIPQELAQPVLWLGDDRLSERAAEAFPGMEVLSANAFKNGVFPRHFSSVVPTSVRSKPAFLRAERDALYSLQRYENVGQIPFLKRRNYLSTVADFLYSAISRANPSHIVLSEAPHTVAGLLAVGICDALGLPILHFQKCGVAPLSRPRVGMEYQPADHLLAPEDKHCDPMTPMCSTVPWMKMLLERLHLEQLPDYELANSEAELRLGGLKGRIRQYMPAFFGGQLLALIESEQKADPGPRLHKVSAGARPLRVMQDISRSIRVTERHRANLAESRCLLEELATDQIDGKAVTFFLHYEPEMTSIPDAQYHSEQLAVARALSTSVPSDVSVYVREHPSQMMFSTRGYLGRDPNFYEEIASLPRVKFLSNRMPYLTAIKGSRLVVTLTGTVAVEAAFVGVPAIAVGRPWYEGLPGCTVVDELADLPCVIEQALNSERGMLVAGDLERFLRDNFIEAVPVPSEARRWAGLGWRPNAESERLARVIRNFLVGVSREQGFDLNEM